MNNLDLAATIRVRCDEHRARDLVDVIYDHKDQICHALELVYKIQKDLPAGKYPAPRSGGSLDANRWLNEALNSGDGTYKP